MWTGIIDFTDKLPDHKNSALFNPSVAYWKDRLYFVSYRKFRRYPDLIQDGKYQNDPYTNPNHPWLGSYPSKTWWWKIHEGNDTTKFSLLEMNDKGSVNIVKSFEKGDLYEGLFDRDTHLFKKGKKIDDDGIQGDDGRLLYVGDNIFILTYNVLLKGRNDVVIKKGKKCSDKCWLIAFRTISIQDNKLLVGPETILCPEVSEVIEKNWSMWVSDSLYFSYGLVPYHKIYKVFFNEDKPTCMLDGKVSSKKSDNNFFQRVEQFFDGKLKVSVSTPALSYKNMDSSDAEYISVGHIKFYIHDVGNMRESGIKKFHKYIVQKGMKFHPVYSYLLFIYTFNPNSSEILKISPFILPGETDWTLVFPSGISYDNRKEHLLISYGDHDQRCKLLLLDMNLVNKILVNIEKLSPNLPVLFDGKVFT